MRLKHLVAMPSDSKILIRAIHENGENTVFLSSSMDAPPGEERGLSSLYRATEVRLYAAGFSIARPLAGLRQFLKFAGLVSLNMVLIFEGFSSSSL